MKVVEIKRVSNVFCWHSFYLCFGKWLRFGIFTKIMSHSQNFRINL